MANSLEHRQIHSILNSLSDAKIVNLDAKIRDLIQPVAASLKPDMGASASLHILCCNEYALVTGIVGGPIAELRDAGQAVRGAVESRK